LVALSSGILLVLVIIGLMISGLFWGYSGVKFWALVNSLIGLGPVSAYPRTRQFHAPHAR
jgi:hypothetical protein